MADIVEPRSLLDRFGLVDFRPGQGDVIDAVLAGRDVMCVMPTGGGKSLCYQLPSLHRDGVTIVVSPLIALMKDQVDALRSREIAATLINSSMTLGEQRQAMDAMAAGEFDLVYVAPERLKNSRFLEAIGSTRVSLLAIDEAHCVSEWGHDFRPDYSRLGYFRKRYLGDVQTIALTATATPTVRDDIVAMLELDNPATFVTGFTRDNLRLSVQHLKTDSSKNDRLVEFIDSQDGAGIVYAATRKRCEEIADWLPERVGRPVGVYHAGLDGNQRHRVQEAFMSGKLAAIVATNAFGMGIDKSDIRYVVHYNIPGSLEAYYQEAGRAGRDGLMSRCELLFSYGDRYLQEFFIDNRYPSKDCVRKVYDFLVSRDEDPIELTLDEVRQGSRVEETAEAVGTAEVLLAKAGVIRRLDSGNNNAIIRIDSDAPTMLDFMPREAKMRRKVMLAIEKVVGRRRYDDVFVSLNRLMELTDLRRDQLSRILRELRGLKAFDYIPPFRGKAIHFLKRGVPFAKVEIDFGELERRKAAEYEKLEAVIAFAGSATCRQRVILEYFGEENPRDCKLCDRCDPSGASVGHDSTLASASNASGGKTLPDPPGFRRGVQVILSGVTRTHGRFGKTLVAQMLCGSKNKKLKQLRLHSLSTYGLLSSMRQSEVVEVMDALVAAGLIEQKEIVERRPTIHVTAFGNEVMMGRTELPPAVRVSYPLAVKLIRAVAHLESPSASGDGVKTAELEGAEHSEDDSGTTSVDPFEQEVREALSSRLKRFRGKHAAALGLTPSRVLSNSVIDRLAELKPTTTTALEAVPGVSSDTVEQFGYDLVQLIQTVLGEMEVHFRQESESAPLASSSLAEPASASAEPKSDELEQPVASSSSATSEPFFDSDTVGSFEDEDPDEPVPSFYWTWQLFEDGYDVYQVADIRRYSLAQIATDLVMAAAGGYSLSSGWFEEDWVESAAIAQKLRSLSR
ncbi:MAG: RecQ family ATP-dependent DNA helicase [Planctomycetota bacterium]